MVARLSQRILKKIFTLQAPSGGHYFRNFFKKTLILAIEANTAASLRPELHFFRILALYVWLEVDAV